MGDIDNDKYNRDVANMDRKRRAQSSGGFDARRELGRQMSEVTGIQFDYNDPNAWNSVFESLSRGSREISRQPLTIAEMNNRNTLKTTRMTLKQRQQEAAMQDATNRAKLGLDLLGLGANLRGPANYLQYTNLLRGAPGMGSAALLGNLTGATGLPDFGAPSGQPEAMTLNRMIADLGGSGAGGVTSVGPSADPKEQARIFQDQVRNLLGQGVHKLNPGWWGKMNPSERGVFQSAAEASGYDMADILGIAAKSGIGQGSPLAAA